MRSRTFLRVIKITVVSGVLMLTARFFYSNSPEWKQYVDPEDAGFSSEKLDAVHQYADSMGSGAVMAIYKGHVLVGWGDIDRKFRAHSVRKSLVSALYGIADEGGLIDLEDTLEDLDISDFQNLTTDERQAKVKDIIASRSGVYLPAAYAPSDQDDKRPERGSHAPGTNWFYNNWDFNVAGVIYEQETGQDLYEAFIANIARPIGMEDMEVTDGFRVFEPALSMHPAHTFRISTRDLARFGQLYLQNGKWNGSQVLSADWIKESTQPISDFGNGEGYGYMWWTVAKGVYEERFPGRYATLSNYDIYLGRGTGGQGVVVIPEADLVFVNRGDTDNSRGVGGGTPLTILDRILAAKVGIPSRKSTLKEVEPVPFASQLPEIETPKFVTLPRSVVDEYIGEYEFGQDAIVRVFYFEDRLFMHVPGRGEAEMFALSDTEFTIQVVSGVHITFDRDTDDGRLAVNLTLGPQKLRAVKRTR